MGINVAPCCWCHVICFIAYFPLWTEKASWLIFIQVTPTWSLMWFLAWKVKSVWGLCPCSLLTVGKRETVSTTYVAWEMLVSCLQMDVHDHLVLACEWQSAITLHFKVVSICLRMRVCMCMCTGWNMIPGMVLCTPALVAGRWLSQSTCRAACCRSECLMVVLEC